MTEIISLIVSCVVIVGFLGYMTLSHFRIRKLEQKSDKAIQAQIETVAGIARKKYRKRYGTSPHEIEHIFKPPGKA